jgi:hypothetical protein
MRGILWLGFLVACGGDEGGNTTVDAAPIVDSAGPVCLVSANFADLGAKTGTTSQGPSTMTIVLDAGPPRDSFFLKLNAGKGVFPGALTTGTFQIAGAELSQATCGLCVNIIADIVTGQGPSKFYFATGGTVMLTSHTPPTGTLANVTFTEVDAGGMPVGSGCATTISAMQFSGT